IRYTQRGAEPSTVGGPYTVESHMADAIAILDLFGQEKAWAVGHSWGGHLALHLAVAYPQRLYGIVCIDPLGASDHVLPEYEANLRRGLTVEENARIDEIEQHEKDGTVTEEDLLEELRIVWPAYFFDRTTAPPCPIEHVGVEAALGTRKSRAEHFEAGTLRRGVRTIDLPALFVHGIADPLPIRSSVETAKRIRGARGSRAADTSRGSRSPGSSSARSGG